MATAKNEGASRVLRILYSILLLIAPPALIADGVASVATKSLQPNSELIQRLTSARTTDWNSARDPTVSPTRQGTFLNQMNKADRAIRELEHGFAVSRSELDDALWIPPKHISPRLRAQLIQELENAKRQDDRNEQQMLFDSTWNNAGSIPTVTFDRREQLVDSTIEDLEIGEPVHWSTIKQALGVAPSPY
jgi:hypothetical protein